MFLEIDLPALAVDVPSSLFSQRLNLQDDIYLKMLYDKKYNPDSLFYSANMIYDFD